MEKKQKKINKYASRSQMVEDIITWNDFYGPATKEAAYKERFAEIHARLLHSDGAKFPLAAFIQKHKLSAVEVFLLLRVSALDTLRLVSVPLYKITTLLQDAQIIGPRTEAMRILLDRQSALFTAGVLGIARGCIELKHNFLSAPATTRKKTVKKRTLSPLRVLKELNKYVIGQEAAKKQLVAGVFENLLVRHDAGKDIGFTKAPAVYGKTLTADDYIQAGMVPELMGRFTYLLQLSGLEKDELRRILLNPYHGPFQQYKDLLKSQQELLPELVEQMVDAAYERRLGARGLQQQVERLFQEQFLQQSVQIEI